MGGKASKSCVNHLWAGMKDECLNYRYNRDTRRTWPPHTVGQRELGTQAPAQSDESIRLNWQRNFLKLKDKHRKRHAEAIDQDDFSDASSGTRGLFEGLKAGIRWPDISAVDISRAFRNTDTGRAAQDHGVDGLGLGVGIPSATVSVGGYTPKPDIEGHVVGSEAGRGSSVGVDVGSGAPTLGRYMSTQHGADYRVAMWTLGLFLLVVIAFGALCTKKRARSQARRDGSGDEARLLERGDASNELREPGERLKNA